MEEATALQAVSLRDREMIPGFLFALSRVAIVCECQAAASSSQRAELSAMTETYMHPRFQLLSSVPEGRRGVYSFSPKLQSGKATL